jgi:hypothetical protein
MTGRQGHRVHVIPWLRRPGSLLLRNWLAITIGRDILAWRRLGAAELAHELAHVRQWRRYGALFAVRYVMASVASLLGGTGWYHGNRYEVEARRAEAEARRAAAPQR